MSAILNRFFIGLDINWFIFSYGVIISTLLNPLRGSFYAFFSFPALRTGLFKLNHIRGFKSKIQIPGTRDNLNNRPENWSGKQNDVIGAPNWVQ